MNFEIISKSKITAIAQMILSPYDTIVLSRKLWIAVGCAAACPSAGFIVVGDEGIKYISIIFLDLIFSNQPHKITQNTCLILQKIIQ